MPAESAKKPRRGRPARSTLIASPLASLTGSVAAEQVLFFISINGHGYAGEIERILGLSSAQAFDQLRRFEDAGFLERIDVGRTATFAFAGRPVADKVRDLVAFLASQMSDSERQSFAARRKPRATGKKLSFGNKPPQERT